ncbi:MAG: hypothetical protein ABT02_04775 [Comamonadaceae bacterium SCN 68-20]|nr:MAG: hypothetical protein ABT02_04775 [Comamonadaceae bacterium SCN 68-20]OJX28196.1 MAG: hypothetical protein BGO75_11740 [Burkholderiales bacterium 68-20]
MDAITNLWSGRAGLARTYWGYGVAASLPWALALWLLAPGSPAAIAVVFAFCAYAALANIGIWRAASAYAGPAVWAMLGKVVSVLGLLAAAGAAAMVAVALEGGNMQVPRARLPAYQGQGAPAPAPAGPHDSVDVELARMDSTHPGWRDTVKSQEFHDWMATQNPGLKAAVDTADTADKLSDILRMYEAQKK